ncbi:unnamed protein product, partial [Ectocarpus sp. 8 AP-2014]
LLSSTAFLSSRQVDQARKYVNAFDCCHRTNPNHMCVIYTLLIVLIHKQGSRFFVPIPVSRPFWKPSFLKKQNCSHLDTALRVKVRMCAEHVPLPKNHMNKPRARLAAFRSTILNIRSLRLIRSNVRASNKRMAADVLWGQEEPTQKHRFTFPAPRAKEKSRIAQPQLQWHEALSSRHRIRGPPMHYLPNPVINARTAYVLNTVYNPRTIILPFLYVPANEHPVRRPITAKTLSLGTASLWRLLAPRHDHGHHHHHHHSASC